VSEYKVELSDKAKELAGLAGLEEDYLVNLVEQLLKKADELGYNLGGNIVVGLDVNGPIVACDDVNLMPFPGAIESIENLMNADGVEVTLMTGWDLSTMGFFKCNKLKLPQIGIVGEYGMVYERGGNFRYLYPYREEERLEFMYGVLKVAAEMDVKVAFQGNYSPGSGAIYAEGDEHGQLLSHALVKDRRPTMKQLYEAVVAKSDIELAEDEEKIIFENKPENLKGIAEALFKTHPLISVRVKKEDDGKLSMYIDPKDKPDFDFEKVKEFAKLAGEQIGRKALPYEDHGVDLISREAEEGNYSKDAGLREYGKDAFENKPFISAIVGDKGSDIPKTIKDTIMFPLKGAEAEKIADEKSIPSVSVVDVRDFALALAEAHRIKTQQNA
jgi:hypothetical protein